MGILLDKSISHICVEHELEELTCQFKDDHTQKTIFLIDLEISKLPKEHQVHMLWSTFVQVYEVLNCCGYGPALGKKVLQKLPLGYHPENFQSNSRMGQQINSIR